MKVLVIKPFIDKKEGVTRNPGDTFISKRERFNKINSTMFGELVKEIPEENKVEVKEETVVKEKKKKASKSG